MCGKLGHYCIIIIIITFAFVVCEDVPEVERFSSALQK